MRFFAIRHNRRAIQLEERGQPEAAIRAYHRAIDSDTSWSVPWYNLGLLYKRQLAWRDSLRCNREAVNRNTNDGDAWWNLGIAATALQDWRTAREAWSHCGIDLPDTYGSFDANLGVVPVRINPDGDGEVIWTRRIDPARAVILSVPWPESNHRYQDLLLHDGAPNGYRVYQNEEVPVFDELQRIQESTFGTFETYITVGDARDVLELEDLAVTRGVGCEDWSTIRPLCKRCSEGHPHTHQARVPSNEVSERRIGLAANTREEAEALLQAWSSEDPVRAAQPLTTLVEPLRIS